MKKLNDFILDYILIIVTAVCLVLLYFFGMAIFVYGSIFVIVATLYYWFFRPYEFVYLGILLVTILMLLVSLAAHIILAMVASMLIRGDVHFRINTIEDNNYSIVCFTNESIVVNTKDGIKNYILSDKELYRLNSKYRDTNGSLNITKHEYWFSDKAIGYGTSSTRFDIVKDIQ